VIIDLPPTLGLAETIRLSMAADNIALVIRWGRTERALVQFAVNALRSAGASRIAVILNDIDLKSQRRRGYRDHTVIYTDKGLYRVAPEYQELAARASLPMAAVEPDARSETSRAEPQRGDTPRDQPRAAASDIERLYNRLHD
jgi:Mrp family chromosome partitioning ATPase